MSRIICAIALVTIALPSAVEAHDRPFVFSFATSRDAARLVRIDYEAAGGARMLVGPSLHVAPLKKRWQLSFAGGPTFHPATSPRTSDAIRDLPATTGRGGYAVRTTFACRF
jgi:hypothetical protein